MHDELSRIDDALQALQAGGVVIVVDDEDRENEGDLIFAAEKATPELLAFMVRYTSGYICVPLTGEDCDRLDLPPGIHGRLRRDLPPDGQPARDRVHPGRQGPAGEALAGRSGKMT